MTNAIENLRPAQRAVVRDRVHDLLARSASWQRLAPQDRARVEDHLRKVVAYLADPAAGQTPARALEETGAEKLQQRLAGKQDLVQKDFTAQATREGTAAFRDVVGAVNFPEFVSGLIEGVFTSIVNSSIRQMDAYGKLLEAVVKTVDQYATDHATPNQGRDYLTRRFPDTFSIRTEGDSPRLALRDDAPEDALQRVKSAFGLDSDIDVDDETSEAELARRAQLEMARMRQQQLATMVLLGINRIVVTDGLINAKVVFEMKASDTAQRANRASMYDTAATTEAKSGGGWFSDDWTKTSTHQTVVSSATDDTSEAKAQIKANLSGEVRVNFKSETFPLEKMASATQITSVTERAQR